MLENPGRINHCKSKSYIGYSSLSKITIPLFNKCFAFILMLVGLPLFLIIALIIKFKDRGPIFYKGIRLGKDKVPFVMYKFRTLPVGAQSRIGARLLSPKDFQLSWFSKFLRETRLDELPQLFNILKGDMDFVGPRPIRPEIYEKYCKHIPNYDLRFVVRPGLIGYSQLFTPHSAPKKLRAIIDNRLIRFKKYILGDILIILLTIAIVAYKSFIMLCSGFWNYIVKAKILCKFQEKRRYDRVKQDTAFLEVIDKNKNFVHRFLVDDINEEYFRVEINRNLNSNQLKSLKKGRLLCIVKKKNGNCRKKKAEVDIELTKEYVISENEKKKYYMVFKYLPRSEFNRYIIDTYFLKKALFNLY
ncbi:MAG: sugar transferase [Desulfonauticus sp.]|nr:sugar transferase [Desulfonauticus sp.]